MSTQRIPGFCALCRSRCGCISVVEDGKLVAVEPDPGHPTGKSLCVVLTSAKVVQFCHSQHRSLPQLRRHSPDPVVELHPATAGPRGIAPNDWVLVETPRATMRARARLNGNLAPDVVCAQFEWWQACEALSLPGYDVEGPASANYNGLIDTDVADPISGTVPLRSYLCEVRKASS